MYSTFLNKDYIKITKSCYAKHKIIGFKIMTHKIDFVALLLISNLLLSGCNLIQGIFSYGHKEKLNLPNINLSPEYCGDDLKNVTSYPTKIYPVFFDVGDSGSEINKHKKEIQDFIKSNLCKNVILGYTSNSGKFQEVLILGYFLNGGEAEQLKNEVGNYLSEVQVGISYEMKLSPSELKDFAKLTKKQVEELFFNINELEYSDFKPIVPAYIPEGFKVSKFEVVDLGGYRDYNLMYKNDNNFCFQISGSSTGWGDGASELQSIEVISQALGKVVLEYTENHRNRTNSSISLGIQPGVLGGHQAYWFTSPVNDEYCYSISIQEAVKIVESLQYLNPLH